MLKFLKTKNCITIFHDGKKIFVSSKAKSFKKVESWLKTKNYKAIIDELMISDDQRVKKLTGNQFCVKDGKVFVIGCKEEAPEYIANKIVEFYDNKLPYTYLINFWKNLSQNPSERSKQELFVFLTKNHFPLTSDGCFVAYKKVKEVNDILVDTYSGKFNNMPGKVVSVARAKVDPDKNVGCSYGLHVGAYEYVKDFDGDTLIEVKVNPKDVVSVPEDCNFQKMRVCKYFVLGVGTGHINQITMGKKQITAKVKNNVKEVIINTKQTASDIVDLVKNLINFKIKISLKSKKAIVAKAIKLLTEKGFKVHQ